MRGRLKDSRSIENRSEAPLPIREAQKVATYSRMNVTSKLTRYSVILPFSTLPFSEITSNPVTPRRVFVARCPPFRCLLKSVR